MSKTTVFYEVSENQTIARLKELYQPASRQKKQRSGEVDVICDNLLKYSKQVDNLLAQIKCNLRRK